ncbi:MAG: QueT transporter family protein [Oscillospiraceae bacterium]|nr:QueT transporter family protein [Oscillospiraceae bacterium]
MTKSRKSVLFIAQAAIIAALYAGVTLALGATPIHWISYGPVQFRFAEALTMLAALTPAAIPGLTIGTFFANLGSPYGWFDWVFGTLASLLAAVCTWQLRKIEFKRLPLFAGLPPVIFNALVVPAIIITAVGLEWSIFPLFAAQVALGQLVVVYALGMPLLAALRRTRIFNEVRR